MEAREPNIRFARDLACPECGCMLEWMFHQDRFGRWRRIKFHSDRAEKEGPWAEDDVLEARTEPVTPYQKVVTGRRWVHTVELMCSGCGRVLSRGQAVRKTFSEDELPHRFYDVPFGGDPYVPDDVIPSPIEVREDALSPQPLPYDQDDIPW